MTAKCIFNQEAGAYSCSQKTPRGVLSSITGSR